MNRMPWFKFFPDDWITGTREMSVEEKAAWIDLLAFMWKAEPRGTIKGTWQGIARMLGLPWLDCERIICSMRDKNYLNLTEPNGIVTITSRRMVREENSRESSRLRQKRHYNAQPNAHSNANLTDKTQKSEVRRQIKDKDKDVSLELEKTSSSQAETPLLIFPVVGRLKEWRLLKNKVDEWQTTFPGIRVEEECRKAWQWLKDNPRRQKTDKGMGRFLFSWLERSQNNGRRTSKDFGATSDQRILDGVKKLKEQREQADAIINRK